VTAPLPIDPVLPALLDALRLRGSAVLVAPPGAGKTTRVPPAILDGGLARAEGGKDGRIILLEPRRVAARAAARRIAAERGGELGDEVGFRIRFERRETPRTRILVVTEGMLVALLQQDPFLEGISTLVFDEFHERNLDSDLALAMAVRLREEARPDLRIVAMSATIDPEPLARFLGGAEPAPIIESPGRLHPITIRHRPPPKGERLEASVTGAVEEVLAETSGDVLVFLPGRGEIGAAERVLKASAAAREVDILPLHGELPAPEQDRALRAGARRRVVLATNVAESSVTVEGVTAVVDSGLARVPRLDLSVGLDRLERGPISRASADQRAGRAGRIAPGLCLRLWSPLEERALRATEVPEISRVDLSAPVLQLLAWGETDLGGFPWFEAPERASLERALHLLERLGAVRQGRITPVGERLARLPLSPRLGRLVLAAASFGHLPQLALAAALLSERDPLRAPPDARRGPPGGSRVDRTDSDILTRLQLLESPAARRSESLQRGAVHRILRARDQIERSARRHLGEVSSGLSIEEALGCALLLAFPDRLARRRDGSTEEDRRAVMVGGRGVRLRPESGVVDAELFLCIDIDAGRRGELAEAGVRQASAVERSWLDPELLEETGGREFDPRREAVVDVRRTVFDDLVIEERLSPAPPDADTGRCLAEAAAHDLGAALSLDDPDLASLRARSAWLATQCPELGLPHLDDEALARLLPELCAGRRSFAELRRAPLVDFVRGLLEADQWRALERGAPERIEVPSGSRIRIDYSPDRPPILAVRIQEIFGWTETPRLAEGRAPLLLHLLAPNHRPQQVTDDLRSFWENTYPVVRKELRRRYPRHAWPEDPWTAQAEKRPRRRGG